MNKLSKLLQHTNMRLQVVAGKKPCYIMFLSQLVRQRVSKTADAKLLLSE